MALREERPFLFKLIFKETCLQCFYSPFNAMHVREDGNALGLSFLGRRDFDLSASHGTCEAGSVSSRGLVHHTQATPILFKFLPQRLLSHTSSLPLLKTLVPPFLLFLLASPSVSLFVPPFPLPLVFRICCETKRIPSCSLHLVFPHAFLNNSQLFSF